MSEEKKKKFVMAEDGIAPDSVPKKKLNNGLEMPAIGMGTFGSDRFTPVQVANAVVGAAEYGQRAFDCASVYGNEKEIGESLKVILDGGVPLGFCPIGSPNRPDRDKTEMDTVDTEDPVVTKIAARLGVCIRLWSALNGLFNADRFRFRFPSPKINTAAICVAHCLITNALPMKKWWNWRPSIKTVV
ncbi:MAG: alcohol dehydrogenase [Verrucomicrobiota bacterium]|jgi:hypothetical protein|nr:alcohol dehydrogenase [Verrucomicrobiota bacterium]MDK2964104.1 alcohol dehydrogenase [Verrucomicrobiota bacterium]